MSSKAEEILNKYVTDGTGIEVTQGEALSAMKEIAELSFNAGQHYGFADGADILDLGETLDIDKETFINKLFNNE